MHGWNSGLSDEASERQNRQKSAPDESESIIIFNPVCLVDYAICESYHMIMAFIINTQHYQLIDMNKNTHLDE